MTVPGTRSGQPLPNGWRWVKLEDVSSTISKGTTPTTLGFRYTDAGIPFLRAEDVNGWAIEVDKVAFYISNDADEVLSRSRLLPGDFLITIAGTLGRVGYVPPEVPHLNCNQAVAFARIDQSKVDVQYLCFACSLEHVIAPLLDQKAGGALQNLNLQQIRCLGIPLPHLCEQQRIAGVLREQMAAVEKARAAAQARLEAVKAMPAAFLRQVLPQPGQSLPDGWKWVKLGEVCVLVGGSTPDTGTSDYWDGEIVWVTPTDLGKLSNMTITATGRRITHAGLQSCGTEMLPIGTVIMSSRAPIGHLAIAGVSLCTNQGCKSFVPSQDVDSVFLYWILKQSVPDIQALGSGATFAEVSKSALQQFKIPLTSLSEQQRIAGLLREQMAAVEKACAAAEAELKTINALPAALLHRAFNGDL